MNTIKVITELSPEDRKLLEGLMGSVSLLASVLGNMQPTPVQQKIIQDATENLEHPADAPVAHLDLPTEPAPEPAPAAPEVKPVSLAEFQKAVTQAVAKGPKQKAAAKEIINKYAASVSAVPEDKRAEVMEELSKI